MNIWPNKFGHAEICNNCLGIFTSKLDTLYKHQNEINITKHLSANWKLNVPYRALFETQCFSNGKKHTFPV